MHSNNILKNFKVFKNVLGVKINNDEFKKICKEFALLEDIVSEDIYFENEKEGIAFLCEGGIVDTVFFFGEGKDGYRKYKGQLVMGLTFNSVKEDVYRAMGKSTSFSPPKSFPGVSHGGWDRYDLGKYAIHFTYSISTGTIELFTLMLA